MTKGKNLRVAVIGAGAAGILAAIKLQEYGVEEVRVFEKESDLGGTWRDNTYPGPILRCAFPSLSVLFCAEPGLEPYFLSGVRDLCLHARGG